MDMTAGSAFGDLAERLGSTHFLGHGQLAAIATVTALMQDGRSVDTVAAGAAPAGVLPWM